MGFVTWSAAVSRERLLKIISPRANVLSASVFRECPVREEEI